MTTVVRVLAVPIIGAGYYEDQAALHRSHVPVSRRFETEPVTAGFHSVRELAEGVSVGLVLDTGKVAWGDCVAVAYCARSGRDEVFRSEQGIAAIEQAVAPALEGCQLSSFKELAAMVDQLTVEVELVRPVPESQAPPTSPVSRRDLLTAPARVWQSARGLDTRAVERVIERRPLHTAIRYGVSQALLSAVAVARGCTMAEVVADEWDLALPDALVPLHAQSGGERYYNAEKMIVRRIASLPHGLVDQVEDQLGARGQELVRYARWLRQRIIELGGTEYNPAIHLDVHGSLGQIFDNNLGQVLGQIYALHKAVEPFRLRIESPVVMESRQSQIAACTKLREYLQFRKLDVDLVVDEWANTLDDIRAFVDAGAADMIQIKMPDLGSIHNAVEAVLACQSGGIASLLGGSYVETEISSRASIHVALATRPDLVMAKPGLGVDEAVSLSQNEMVRTLASIAALRAKN